MIEFKAACGHTVRAKDEHAGGVVRCSYCGRQAAVPLSQNDNLDFLFRDVEQPQEEGRQSRRKRRREQRRLLAGGVQRPVKMFDARATIVRMCYAALLIVIVYLVGKWYVLPIYEGGVSRRTVPRSTPLDAGPASSEAPTEVARPFHYGMIGLRDPQALYVHSTPPDATVFYLESSKAPAVGRINRVPGCVQAVANDEPLRLPDGDYVLEVVLPWNDPRLNDPEYPYYQPYREFRRAVEHASDEQRRELMEEYFVPDEAWPVFVEQTPEQIFLIRQYRDVVVRGGQPERIEALFLPRIRVPGKNSFSVEPLVMHYIPKQRNFNFDEAHVRNELDYYGVPVSDRPVLIESLTRIGVVPYVTTDGRTRFFKIGLLDGTLRTKVIREAPE